MSSGDWFDSSEINKTPCMVVNKAAQNYFDTSYAVGNVESSLSLTPFNVVGTVNDGTDIPTVYLDAHSIELLVPNMWKVKCNCSLAFRSGNYHETDVFVIT